MKEGAGRGLIPADAGSTAHGARAWRAPRAHPRGRGEHSASGCSSTTPGGSSPRTRGARRIEPVGTRFHGLIPADAGSTRPRGSRPLPAGAHPRGRGEHEAARRAVAGVTGSSPRTRGAPDRDRYPTAGAGLIPADAGSTELRKAEAHHRAGSSPRTRGARCSGGAGARARGLIPADAGSTSPSLTGSGPAWAHPRGRGEHAPPGRTDADGMGSSPRTRGAPGRDVDDRRQFGLIPADAGSTRTAARRCTWTWAHPRGRGEHQGAGDVSTAQQGSSPRTRGARVQRRHHDRGRGLIPADAGSTDARGAQCCRRWAHPRGRGEHRDRSTVICPS